MAVGITFPNFTQTDRAVGWRWIPPSGISGRVLSTATALAQGSVVNVTTPGCFVPQNVAVPIPSFTMVVNNAAHPSASIYRAAFIDLP